MTRTRATAYYRVNALGFASNVMLPARKMNVGAKYFKEFSDRSTFQGILTADFGYDRFLGYSLPTPRRRWAGSTFSDSPASAELLANGHEAISVGSGVGVIGQFCGTSSGTTSPSVGQNLGSCQE